MKKTLFFVAVAMVLITMIGCGGKSQNVPFDNGDSLAIANADPTVYGVCGVETTMNELQLVTDNGDTLMLDLSAAIENGKFFGGLQVGDRMAVVPNADRTAAVMAINQSTLMGNWVMPNPLDGSDEVGIRIKEGGIAESMAKKRKPASTISSNSDQTHSSSKMLMTLMNIVASVLRKNMVRTSSWKSRRWMILRCKFWNRLKFIS